MPRKSTGRPPGAPLNNINHLKHSLYPTPISVKADDELVLIRVRIMTCLEKQYSVSAQDWLSAFESLFSDHAITPWEESNLIRIAREMP